MFLRYWPNGKGETMNRIAITMDTDWVPEEVMTEMLDLLRRYRIKATVFATGEYKCLMDLGSPDNDIEVGIHPRINSLDEIDYAVEQLQAVYPRAVGVRVHTLAHSSRFHGVFIKKNIRYSSNSFFPGMVNPPVKYFGNLWEFPIYFMDDYYLYRDSPLFTISDLELERPGLKITAFHPIHIFLNQQSIDGHEKIKHGLTDFEFLVTHRREGIGIRKMFLELLEYLHNNNIPSYTLSELLEELK